MKYITQVDDQVYEIEISPDNQILVNGEAYEMDFRQMPDSGVASLLINNRSLEAVVEQRNGNWEVLIEGELYTVAVTDERAHRLAQARGTLGEIEGEASIQSPMPGIIIAVPVQEGDSVSKGDKVVILESMKMENELRSPTDGIVSLVNVEAGASVEKDQVLVVISNSDE